MAYRSEEQMRRQVLERLRMGPATTTQLQRELDLPHVAKQISDLRKRPGIEILARRVGVGGEARYSLREYIPESNAPECDICGRQFGETRDTIVPGIREGKCFKHGWRPIT